MRVCAPSDQESHQVCLLVDLMSVPKVSENPKFHWRVPVCTVSVTGAGDLFR